VKLIPKIGAVIFLFVLYSFIQVPNCDILKNGKFTYKLGKETVYVTFTEIEQIEYHKNRKYYIKSSISWFSDCKYFLTIKESTLPDFPFKIGTKLTVKIKKVKGNSIFYETFSPDGRSWKGKFIKIRE